MNKIIDKKTNIILDESAILRAKEFASNVVGTCNYADSNQNSSGKIMNDYYTSKMGEEAVCMVFKIYGAECSSPDYNIYVGSDKSWSPNLNVNGLGVAVKTQRRSSAQRYGLSWMFQVSPVHRDHILDEPDAWVVFVEYDDVNGSNEFIVFPPMQIKDIKFGDPKLDYLKGKQKVVYASDVGICR